MWHSRRVKWSLFLWNQKWRSAGDKCMNSFTVWSRGSSEFFVLRNVLSSKLSDTKSLLTHEWYLKVCAHASADHQPSAEALRFMCSSACCSGVRGLVTCWVQPISGSGAAASGRERTGPEITLICVRVCIWVFGLYSGLNSFSNFVLHFSADALVLLQLFCTSEAEVSVSFTEPHRPLWSIQAPRLHRNFSRCWIMSSEYRGVQLEQNGTEPVHVCCYHCCSFVLPTVA